MTTQLRLAFLLLIFCAVAGPYGCTNTPAVDEPPETGPSGDWPQWRGPSRDGVSASSGLLASWGRGEPRQIWRREIGVGFASIAVADGAVFTLHGDGDQEVLLALDARDGSERWSSPLGAMLRDKHGDGPRTTPAIDSGTVYALGSGGRLVALNAADGELQWDAQLEPPPTWGYCSSPLVEGELVIVNGNLQSAAVLAFNKTTGELAWSAETGHPGYASPMAVTLGGQRQIISFIASGLVALAPESGSLLWSHPWTTSFNVNAADPIFLPPDRFFISSGYDTGASSLHVSGGGDSFETAELWRNREMKNHFSSSVRVGDHIYGFDNAIFKCIVAETGETCWRQRGFGKGSLIATPGGLIVLGDEGTLALVEPTPEKYRENGSVKALAEGGSAPPVLAGQWLYLRDAHEIVCLNLAADEA